MAQINDWVQIHRVILAPEQRASQVPDDTKLVPLELWLKGYLLTEAKIGDEVSIRTVTGRVESGTLVEINPVYHHSFGEYMPEITQIHRILEQELAEDEQ